MPRLTCESTIAAADIEESDHRVLDLWVEVAPVHIRRAIGVVERVVVRQRVAVCTSPVQYAYDSDTRLLHDPRKPLFRKWQSMASRTLRQEPHLKFFLDKSDCPVTSATESASWMNTGAIHRARLFAAIAGSADQGQAAPSNRPCSIHVDGDRKGPPTTLKHLHPVVIR